jgi:hypothetical protein
VLFAHLLMSFLDVIDHDGDEFNFRDDSSFSFENFSFQEFFEALREDPEVDRCTHKHVTSRFH